MKPAVGARRVQSLNGTWDIAPGTADAPSGGWNAVVPVPSLVDCAVPPYDWQSSPYHWYRLLFRVEGPQGSGNAIVRIGQAMFGTCLWLNGNRLGEDIACYTSQEYDAAPHLRYDGQNELIVRVGLRDTLPPESAVGRDQERQTFIPGIWGDVTLTLCGNPRVALVQVIPRNAERSAEVKVTVRNSGPRPVNVHLLSRIREHASGNSVGPPVEIDAEIPPGEDRLVSLVHGMNPVRAWSPASPFLYDHCADLAVQGETVDRLITRFGMREFRIQEGGFFLNGKRIFLRGGNIAFHRFLSDADRGLLPWDTEWVRKLLVEIPKAHNFNFFRAHIGQMYSRWYDIADEGGILLQNEWMFWTTTGTEPQITREFTRWLEDNWNHPSIVIWDALNESSDFVVQDVVVPKMKKLDPTRPWESVDFLEEHPYIYALGPVLNAGKFGFARGLREIEESPGPSMLNEFLWWWLDADNNPTLLTRDVIERWLGSRWTKDDLVARQSFLACELVELFRRMRVDAIQPFVYLSNSAGPTGHWFLGDIARLVPKPLLAALKNAFAPFGVSVEMWDRHFTPGEKRSVRLFVFNDDPVEREGEIRIGVVGDGDAWVSETRVAVSAGASRSVIVPVDVTFPEEPGSYEIVARLSSPEVPGAESRKIAHVIPHLRAGSARGPKCLVLDSRGEISAFLSRQGFAVAGAAGEDPEGSALIVAGEGILRGEEYLRHISAFGAAVRAGACLLVIEPEFGSREKETLRVIEGFNLTIEHRADTDKGGYDSYVFPENESHPLWGGIPPAHLRMFNGALGGEMISQHSVTPDAPVEVLARCGLKLAHPAVMFMRSGRGCVVVSRLQTRGRLSGSGERDHLFARRVDPVACRYMINLATVFLAGERTA
jgi:beta-galactosidase